MTARIIPEPAPDCRYLPIADVRPDPSQPRKAFDVAELDNLAASIKAKGQQTPADVRADPECPGKWLLIAGERRYRALTALGALDILVIIREMTDAGEILDAQIIENVIRAAMTPMEEARAYQRRLDQLGGDVGELARRLGLRQAWRIPERTCLLNMLPEYQKLFESGNLSRTEAYHLGQLQPANQRRLFDGIRRGLYPNHHAIRAAQVALSEQQQQGEMFAGLPPEPTPEEKAALTALERKIDRAYQVLKAGFSDNEIVVVKRVDPSRAVRYADRLALVRRHLLQMETALRAAATANTTLSLEQEAA